jgi:hypothetical protein
MSDEVTGYPGAPPDWYPDPAGGPGKRWWDGYAWTDGVVLPTQPPAPPTGAPAPGTTTGYGATRYATPTRGNAPVLLDGELRISQLARAAVVIIGIYYLWEFINLQLESSLYRSIGHQYHRMIVARENNQPVPHLDFSNHANSGLVALGGLLGLATIGAVVVACMWQYRAASTARALGYAAKHSPGWGVGCWFVPIVALWMPYQALRDCLPPDDPNRRLVRTFWAFFIGQAVFALAAAMAAFSSTSLSLVFSVPGALLCLGMLSTAPRFVSAIAVAHRHALGRAA